MAAVATLFRSGRSGTDTLVVSPYPVAGNDRNTGPRYAREAAITGFDVLGGDARRHQHLPAGSAAAQAACAVRVRRAVR